MTPYYERNGIAIYQGDCLDVLPCLQPPVDMVLVDLPYGTTQCAWDIVIPFAPMWEQVKRLVKPNAAIVMTGSQPFTSLLVASNLGWFGYEWIWEKSVGTGYLDANRKPLKCHESVLVFYDKPPTYNPIKSPAAARTVKRSRPAGVYGNHKIAVTDNQGEAYPRSILYFSKELGTVHRTQKPLALFSYLIATYTNPGDLVLDFTMGSGTTLEAAKKLGRRAIGIDIDSLCCEQAARRLAQDVLPLAV